MIPCFPLALLGGCASMLFPELDKDSRDEFTIDTEPGDSDTDETGTTTETDTETTGETDTETTTDSEDTTDSGVIGDEEFDEPGDVVVFDAADDTTVDLTDVSGDSNQDQDFYLIMINSGEDETSFGLRYTQATAGPPAKKEAETRRREGSRPRETGMPLARRSRDILTDADIGSAADQFQVRNDLNDDETYDPVDATLWALGDNVEIWVDNEVYIDWDYECDGVVDVTDPRGAQGFDNCDLATVADVVDLNIIPNVRSLFGSESDIDLDGRVAVLITARLNRITLTSDDEDDHRHVLPSYTEPQVDLTDYDRKYNPGSDEREVIYVFAPDPSGYLNESAPQDVASYTNYNVLAEIARGFTALVSYNQHVIVWDEDGDEDTAGTIEADWMNDALGSFAADYCGFGSAYYHHAWEYLDRPWYYPLITEDRGGSLSRFSQGAQYLFALWLYNWAVETGQDPIAMFNAMVQTESTGADAIEEATSESFAHLVIGWQASLLTTGVSTLSGDPLLDDTEYFIPYSAPTTISSPPAARDNHYGANGYQMGFAIRGENQPWIDGHTDAPSLDDLGVVRAGGSDFFMYNTAFDFTGYVAGGYAAKVVRLTGIPYDMAALDLQVDSTDMIGAVVRWNDPTSQDWAVENIFSSSDANSMALPELTTTEIHALGELSESSALTSYDPDGETSDREILDTDRWLLDLSDRASGEEIEVAIWLDRQFSNDSGDTSLQDPWIAVAPLAWVPEPTEDGTLRGEGCDGAQDFGYPSTLLDYLYYQLVLSEEMIGESSDDFEPCGVVSETETTCETDWDGDGVLDTDEPQPGSFFDQVRAQQCALNDNVPVDPSVAYSDQWLDWDESDEDEDATTDYFDNTGGQSGPEGEEAYVRLTLTGGEQYLVVVGSADSGVYELSLREILE